MASARTPCLGPALAAALVCLLGPGDAAAGEAPPPTLDPATVKVRQILREDGGDPEWGADPPAKEVAERGEPWTATTLAGSGHAMVLIGSDGQPQGTHLRLLQVTVEGGGATASECELRLGQEKGGTCPPAPFSVVDCATWSVPVEAARAALLQARAALFVRVYEKKFIPDPRQEREDDGYDGVSGGISGGTTNSFMNAVSLRESGERRYRVTEEWAGYVSGGEAGRYARADAAEDILRDAFPRPEGVPASPPPPALHAEFSRLLKSLPLDAEYWWWVRERMVLMATVLGEPADLERLKGYLAPKAKGPSELRTRGYALEALARRTGTDPRCVEGRRVGDEAAAAAWRAKPGKRQGSRKPAPPKAPSDRGPKGTG